MTATTTLPVPSSRPSLAAGVGDALAVAQRNLIGLFRVPTTLVFSTVQPVIFVLMFRYVFGGAIETPGFRYVDYLMAGIFVQTVTFGSMNTGVGLAIDMSNGLIERFRSLPMARSAVLAGRTIADSVRNLLVIFLMVVVGFLVGFRVQGNLAQFVGAMLLLLLFGFAMSWVMALIGLSTGNAEAAQAAAFPFMAVLVFASNSFVPNVHHAGPAAGLRRPPAGERYRRRGEGTARWNRHRADGPGCGGLVPGDRRRLRSPGRPPLPPGGVGASAGRPGVARAWSGRWCSSRR